MTTVAETGVDCGQQAITVSCFEDQLREDPSLVRSVSRFVEDHTAPEGDYGLMVKHFSHSGNLLVVKRCHCLYQPCDHAMQDRFKVAIFSAATRQTDYPTVVDADVFRPELGVFDRERAQTILYLGQKAVWSNGESHPGNQTIRYMNVSQQVFYRPFMGSEEAIYPLETIATEYGLRMGRVAMRGIS